MLKENRWLAVFLLSLPYINDTFPSNYFIYFWIQDFFKIISFVIVMLLMIRKKARISFLNKILIFSCVWLGISTLINVPLVQDHIYNKFFYDVLSLIYMGILIECFADEPDPLINGLMLNYELALYPYCIAKIFFTTEKYPRGLLNTLILWIVPAMFLAMLRMIKEKKFVRSAFLIVTCLLTVYKVWSATTVASVMMIYLMFGIGYLLFKTAKIRIPAWLLLVLAFAANLFILFVYSGGEFKLVDFFIERILGKSTTFTERDIIWKEAMRMIIEKPFIGHGSRPVVYAQNSFGSVYIHAHNQLLQKLNEGGIVSLLLFVGFHIELVRRLDKSRCELGRLIVLSFLFGIWLTYIVEAYKDFYLFYPVFFIGYHIDEMLVNDKRCI